MNDECWMCRKVRDDWMSRILTLWYGVAIFLSGFAFGTGLAAALIALTTGLR